MEIKLEVKTSDHQDGYWEDVEKIGKMVNIDAYDMFLHTIFEEVLRYKHREDELCEKYGEKALDLIDDIREKLWEDMEERGIKYE